MLPVPCPLLPLPAPLLLLQPVQPCLSSQEERELQPGPSPARFDNRHADSLDTKLDTAMAMHITLERALSTSLEGQEKKGLA